MNLVTPSVAYARLNKLLWMNRLPNATILFVDNATIPHMHGVTLHDAAMFLKPIIVLNRTTPWGPTLVHEMLHIAEPTLAHGVLFDKIVRRYWHIAKKEIKGIHKSRMIVKPTEAPNVG